MGGLRRLLVLVLFINEREDQKFAAALHPGPLLMHHAATSSSMPNRRTETKKWIHYLLWAYLFALLFDGALRKWFLPGLSDFLLLSRVPIALLIYLLALQIQIFPKKSMSFRLRMLVYHAFPC